MEVCGGGKGKNQALVLSRLDMFYSERLVRRASSDNRASWCMAGPVAWTPLLLVVYVFGKPYSLKFPLSLASNPLSFLD